MECHFDKATIAAGHDAAFASVYAGSSVAYDVANARAVTDHVILGHARSTLTAPVGPLAGRHSAMATVILVRVGAEWQIAAYHNTLETSPRNS